MATFEVAKPRLKLFQEILYCLNVKLLLDGLAAIISSILLSAWNKLRTLSTTTKLEYVGLSRCKSAPLKRLHDYLPISLTSIELWTFSSKGQLKDP